MPCDCCCTKTLRLCSVNVCAESVIDFGITAQVEGTHQLILKFLGVEVLIEKDFAVDDQMTFPVGGLNENFTYTARIYEPDGKQVVIRKDSVEYDCFEFQTVLKLALV